MRAYRPWIFRLIWLYLSPPLIDTYVFRSEKHRHGQALLAMSVFAFWGQDMETWTDIQRFGRFDKDRLAWNGVYPFKAGGAGRGIGEREIGQK
jgi:hypothetical protein